ncbi:MAG TPA: PAS domain-containing protein [Victivallales bacterium]|nr:PAS domain-containing protein [Victivallales bacterium]
MAIFINSRKIKEIRKKRKISQAKLGKILGKSPRTIWGWENGDHIPSIPEIKLLASSLGVFVNDISNLNPDSTSISNIYISDQKKKFNKIHNEISKQLSIEKQAYIDTLRSDLLKADKENKYLLQQNNNYRKIFNRLETYLYTKDTKLRFTETNSAFKTAFNISDEELLGKNNDEIFHNEFNEITRFEQEVLETGIRKTNCRLEIPGFGRKKKGLLSIFPVNDKDGRLISLVCSIRDITSITNVYKNMGILENSINKFNDVVWIKQLMPSPHYFYVSNASLLVFGREPDEFYNNQNIWKEVIHYNDKNKAISIKKYSSFPITQEYRIFLPDGTIKWIRNKIYINRKENTIFGITGDITEQKELEDRYYVLDKLFNDVSTEYTWVSELLPKYRFLFVSDGIAKLFELKKQDLFMNPTSWQSRVNTEDLPYILKSLAKGQYPLKLRYKINLQNGKIISIEEKVIKEEIHHKTYTAGIIQKIDKIN